MTVHVTMNLICFVLLVQIYAYNYSFLTLINEASGKSKYTVRGRVKEVWMREGRGHIKDEEKKRCSTVCADSRKINSCERMNDERQ